MSVPRFNPCTVGYLVVNIAYHAHGVYALPAAVCPQPGSHTVCLTVTGSTGTRDLYATACTGCEVMVRQLTGWRWSRKHSEGPGATWFDRGPTRMTVGQPASLSPQNRQEANPMPTDQSPTTPPAGPFIGRAAVPGCSALNLPSSNNRRWRRLDDNWHGSRMPALLQQVKP